MYEKEYIERNALLKAADKRHNDLRGQCGFFDNYADGYGDCIITIKDAPVEDVVEVVRCKHCLYSDEAEDPITGAPMRLCWYEAFRRYTTDEHYCGHGERKDNNK